jgi:hypothetical protein
MIAPTPTSCKRSGGNQQEALDTNLNASMAYWNKSLFSGLVVLWPARGHWELKTKGVRFQCFDLFVGKNNEIGAHVLGRPEIVGNETTRQFSSNTPIFLLKKQSTPWPCILASPKSLGTTRWSNSAWTLQSFRWKTNLRPGRACLGLAWCWTYKFERVQLEGFASGTHFSGQPEVVANNEMRAFSLNVLIFSVNRKQLIFALQLFERKDGGLQPEVLDLFVGKHETPRSTGSEYNWSSTQLKQLKLAFGIF